MTINRATVLCHVLTVVDGTSEELLDVVEIKSFDLALFSVQFDACPESDPEMRDRYSVGPDDAQFVCETLGFQIAFDFSKYAYFIEAADKDV